jgi:ribulose-phosphate 3-epimerase
MIIPAILQKDLKDIIEEVKTVENFAPLVQVDIADGNLVNNSTYQKIEEILRIKTNVKFDIHLMVNNPNLYLKRNPKIRQISAHAEAPINLNEWIKETKKYNYKVGISLSPETKWKQIEDLISEVDFIQFLTVNPGKQGQEFQPDVLKKIKRFRQKYSFVTIQADGGINETNIKEVLKSGVNNVVIGSAIVRAENPQKTYINFERIENEYRRTI